MRQAQTKLYGFSALLALLPLMDFSISETGNFFRGMEFRNLISELLTQVVSGVVDAFILIITQGLFGVVGG